MSREIDVRTPINNIAPPEAHHRSAGGGHRISAALPGDQRLVIQRVSGHDNLVEGQTRLGTMPFG